jgi:hypothetical protein
MTRSSDLHNEVLRRAYALRSLDPGSPERTLDHLREILAAHEGADGIWFDARTWIVAARRVLSRSGADLQPVTR